MTDYRRLYIPGASWFFTVNLAQRKGNRLLIDNVDLLRKAFAYTKCRHPFKIDAVVVLPDHMHCIWTLPEGDADFSTRWNVLKGTFSKSLEKGERVSASRKSRRERGIYPKGTSGSGDFGNMPCEIKKITAVTWITSIGIR